MDPAPVSGVQLLSRADSDRASQPQVHHLRRVPQRRLLARLRASQLARHPARLRARLPARLWHLALGDLAPPALPQGKVSTWTTGTPGWLERKSPRPVDQGPLQGPLQGRRLRRLLHQARLLGSLPHPPPGTRLHQPLASPLPQASRPVPALPPAPGVRVPGVLEDLTRHTWTSGTPPSSQRKSPRVSPRHHRAQRVPVGRVRP
mmetsp:Transcript_29757/g.69943  ORF Transcript_29757/g.69943 Transcript_29757/m.69943 type:complete len:204 (-) Transcript_29757:635-1246(-)